MILGLSHIMLRVSDLERSIREWGGAGFAVDFIQSDIPNPLAKRSLQLRWSKFHSLAILRASSGPALELISYDHRAEEVSPSTLVLAASESTSASLPNGANLWTIESGPGFVTEKFPTIRLFDGTTGLAAIAIKVRDVEKSQAAWTNGLGYKSVDTIPIDGHREPGVLLELRRPVSAWNSQVVLLPADTTSPIFIDMGGVIGPSFLSKNLENTILQCENFGWQLCDQPFLLNVNNQLLEVVLLRGLNGELIELIQFKSDPKSK